MSRLVRKLEMFLRHESVPTLIGQSLIGVGLVAQAGVPWMGLGVERATTLVVAMLVIGISAARLSVELVAGAPKLATVAEITAAIVTRPDPQHRGSDVAFAIIGVKNRGDRDLISVGATLLSVVTVVGDGQLEPLEIEPHELPLSPGRTMADLPPGDTVTFDVARFSDRSTGWVASLCGLPETERYSLVRGRRYRLGVRVAASGLRPAEYVRTLSIPFRSGETMTWAED